MVSCLRVWSPGHNTEFMSTWQHHQLHRISEEASVKRKKISFKSLNFFLSHFYFNNIWYYSAVFKADSLCLLRRIIPPILPSYTGTTPTCMQDSLSEWIFSKTNMLKDISNHLVVAGKYWQSFSAALSNFQFT